MTTDPAPADLPTHMGFNITAKHPTGFTPAEQDELWQRIELAVCGTEENHEDCPLEHMGSCTGSYDDVYRWHMRDWEAVEAVRLIDPEQHATKSRDYGRGFADAIRLVRQAITDARGPK